MDVFVSEYSFREKRTNELLDETICIIFMEMAKFSKSIRECHNDVDRMIYLLKNMGRLHNQPADLQREIYSRIFEACEIAMFDEGKREIARNLISMGMSDEDIVIATGLDSEIIADLKTL